MPVVTVGADFEVNFPPTMVFEKCSENYVLVCMDDTAVVAGFSFSSWDYWTIRFDFLLEKMNTEHALRFHPFLRL